MIELEGTSVRREPPASTMRALRQIDDKARLIHLGGTLWLLGVQDPVRPAMESAGGMRDKHLTKLPGMRRGEMSSALRLEILNECAAGFRPISAYRCEHPGREMIEDFAERDYNWQRRPEQTFRDRLRDSEFATEFNARKERMREYVESEFPKIHKYVMRGAKNFLQRARPPWKTVKGDTS